MRLSTSHRSSEPPLPGFAACTSGVQITSFRLAPRGPMAGSAARTCPVGAIYGSRTCPDAEDGRVPPTLGRSAAGARRTHGWPKSVGTQRSHGRHSDFGDEGSESEEVDFEEEADPAQRDTASGEASTSRCDVHAKLFGVLAPVSFWQRRG